MKRPPQQVDVAMKRSARFCSPCGKATLHRAKPCFIFHTRQRASFPKKALLALLLIRMLTVGAIIDRPQTTAKHKKRATNGRPYKQISAENLFSLPICVIMMLYRRGAFYMLPIRADMESAPTKGYGLSHVPALLATL